MALCTVPSFNLNIQYDQCYPYQYLYDICNLYRLNFQNVFFINNDEHIRSLVGMNRRYSVQSVVPVINNKKTYNRAISLFVKQNEIESPVQHSIPKTLQFTSVEDEGDDNKRFYSTKTPYTCPSKEYVLSSPPTGYKPIGVQLLARHGSRTLNSHDYDVQTLKIWQLAKQKNMLTPLGEQLKEDTELFIGENNHVGRGELTELGKDEHIGIGSRLFHRLQSLFLPSNTVTVMTSGKKRAVDSSQQFVNGLTESQNDIQIRNQSPNKSLLYFHKSCLSYRAFKKTDLDIRIKIHLIKNLPQTKAYAQQVLRRIYTKDFVDLLTNGYYEIQADKYSDLLDKKFHQNEVDIVICLYSMFSVAQAQNKPSLNNMLAKYFNKEESYWFSYINDAQEFYVKGPSIEGKTVTYDMAKPLLAEFFTSINARIEDPDNTVAAHLRFAHAETIIPFATLLQIPNFSDKSVHPLDIYTYENNPWRGNKIASMAANIQWEIYQHEEHHDQILVRMLYNEMEVKFKSDCKSITSDSFFYDFNELKRSYQHIFNMD
ncbi:unnamed protein product [Adineta steineri]|uniref:Multiple inositol polyphosphate phosphatase 1 n=1 Tax=Adineta steineri TaxID=433720 RepID=A0A813QAJ0_9BILA|nr:unnamed protein product [Adineta steineri]CAF3785749.1 unnamed protein product [Adineta steineri]